jgi:hypothetical protein
MRSRTTVLLPVLCALAAAVPATADAASVSLDRPCYANPVPGHATLKVAGAGFKPGDTVDVTGQQIFSSATVGPGGAFAVQVPAPVLPTISPLSAPAPVTLTATSETNPAFTSSTSFLLTNFAFATTPGQGPASGRTNWVFSGFPTGATIYGHFIFRGRLRGTHRFGRAQGPCGTLKVKAKRLPVRKVSFGAWQVQLDTRARYRKGVQPSITGQTLVQPRLTRG